MRSPAPSLESYDFLITKRGGSHNRKEENGRPFHHSKLLSLNLAWSRATMAMIARVKCLPARFPCKICVLALWRIEEFRKILAGIGRKSHLFFVSIYFSHYLFLFFLWFFFEWFFFTVFFFASCLYECFKGS